MSSTKGQQHRGLCAGFALASIATTMTDFVAYATYAWGSVDTLRTGDRRPGNHLLDSLFDKRSMDNWLPTGFAKLLVHARPFDSLSRSVRERMDVDTVDHQYGYSSETETPERTLSIDVGDAEAKRIIWRGWALS